MEEIKTISIDYPFDSQSYQQDNKDFSVLTINNCPTAIDASKLISESWFLESFKSFQNIKAIVIKISDNFEINSIENPKLVICEELKSFLISFEPQNINNDYQSVAFWKPKNFKNFLSLKNSRAYSSDVFLFVRNFLIKSAIDDHTGFDNSSTSHDKFNLEITNLSDLNGLNILMLAVQNQSNRNLIHEFLKFPFDINQESVDGHTAADLAWQMRKFDILLVLLNANSTFPRDYDEDTASVDVRKFAENCRKMHDAVREENFDKAKKKIEEKVKELPSLRHFYNPKNKSAAAVAIREENIAVYELLLNKSINIGPKEDFDEIKEGVSTPFRRKLKDFHLKYSKDLPRKHLRLLIANCLVGHDDVHYNLRLELVKNAFHILDSIDFCSAVLKGLAAHKKFKIYFDFNRGSIEYIDPMKDRSYLGVFYFAGKIFIGAKELRYQKFITIGTIIHEICHFTMSLVFQNDGKPYGIIDDKAKEEFDEIITKCSELAHHEQIIEWVFAYPKEAHHAEMIVRVVHIMAQYHDDQKKLNDLRGIFKSLFDFWEEKVMPQIEAAFPVIEKLADENFEITLGELTEPLRDRIVHSYVTFQGTEIELSKIINSDNPRLLNKTINEFFNNFNQIDKNKMFDDCVLSIGEEQTVGVEFYLDRKFLKRKLDNRDQWDVRSCEEIAKEVESEKIFLLSDHAGAGKTTTFKHLVGDLKQIFPSFWISFVDLKKHLRIYESYENLLDEEWTKEEILKVLKEILELKDFDEFIFSELYESNKIILLFDGVDEISPNFKEFIMDFIQKLRILTKNQLWIATRPQYANDLEEFFTINARRLKPNDQEEKTIFIRSILQSLNITDESEQMLAIAKVEDFMGKLSSGSEDHDINNPLMLELITKLCADKINAEANFYAIYKDMLKKKVGTVEGRGEIVAENIREIQAVDRGQFTIWQVFQIYSLLAIFGKNFKDVMSDFVETVELDQLSIFRKWKNVRKDWSPEAISRYGVLIVDHWGKENEFGDFIHRTFAEFFVAQYLIENIYEDNDSSVNDSEKMLRLKLLISIGATKSTDVTRLDVIRRFLTSYPDMRLSDTEQIFDEKIKTFLINNYRTSFLFYSKEIANYDAVTATLFLSNFFGKDKKIVDGLWLGNDGKSFFTKIFTSPQNNLHDIMEYVETVERIYGLKWPELTKFIKKRSKNYFLEEKPVKIEGDDVLVRFFRLIDLIQIRLSKAQCKNFFIKYFYDMLESFSVNLEASTEMLNRTKEIFGKKQMAVLVRNSIEKISSPQSCIFNENYVEYFWDKFKMHVKNDKKIVKFVLKFDFVPTSQPLLNAFASNNDKVIEFYKKFYKLYLSNEEILKIFNISKDFYVNNLFYRFSHMTNNNCQQFLDFLCEINIENDEMMKKILSQRDDTKLTYFSCLKNQLENANEEETKEIVGEKIEIFKNCARKFLSEEEISELYESPKNENSYKNYIWNKVINRRE